MAVHEPKIADNSLSKKLKGKFPITKTDQDVPFSFNLYKLQFDGGLFMITALFIPLILLFTIRFTLGFENIGQIIYLISNFVCLTVSLIYFIRKDIQLFMKSGFFLFYAFQMLLPIVSIIFGGLGGLIGEVEDPGFNVWGLFIQTLAEFLIIYGGFKTILDLKMRVKETFKQDGKSLLKIVSLGIIVLTGISLLYSFAVQNTVLGGESENQNSLIKGLKEGGLGVKVTTLVLLALFTILIAPLMEELAARQAGYLGCGNRLVAWFTSACFFAMIHVSSGDVEHFLNYFIAGLVLSTIFNSARGNVTYNGLTHLGYNAISYVVVVSQI